MGYTLISKALIFLSSLRSTFIVLVAVPVFFLALPDGIPFVWAGCGTPYSKISPGRAITEHANETNCGQRITADLNYVQKTGCSGGPFPGQGGCCAIEVTGMLSFNDNTTCCVDITQTCITDCPYHTETLCGTGTPGSQSVNYTGGCSSFETIRIKVSACTCCSCSPGLLLDIEMRCS